VHHYSNCTLGLSRVRSDLSMKSLFSEENYNANKFETVAKGMDKIYVIYHGIIMWVGIS